jgi:hypothetical protein
MLSRCVFRSPAPAAFGGSVVVFAGHDVPTPMPTGPTLSMELGKV